jgi:Flp pilus assembly protein CpaB
MRPKIIILILVAGLAGVIGMLLIKYRMPPPPAATPIGSHHRKCPATRTCARSRCAGCHHQYHDG